MIYLEEREIYSDEIQLRKSWETAAIIASLKHPLQ